MCLYDEENDNFLDEAIEFSENVRRDEEENETEESIENDNESIENSDLLTILSAELEKLECDRKKLKFKYKGSENKYEAVPLKLISWNKKCIFNIIKPAGEQGLKAFYIGNILYE